jgi:hypothetical protein
MSAADITAQAAITGSSALFVALLGVEPQAIVWSLVGCVLGVTLAKPASRLYTVFLFLAATLACALWGTMASDHFFGGSALARNSISVLLGAVFHPLLAAVIGTIPGIVTWGAERVQRLFGGHA